MTPDLAIAKNRRKAQQSLSPSKNKKSTDLKNIEQIKQELESSDELLLEYDYDAFDEEYFNELEKRLDNFKVSEIRPQQKILITKGIKNKNLTIYLNQLLKHITSYNKLRKEVFSDFITSLDIDKIEGEFYKLREKLQNTGNWPRGNYKQWKYCTYGGDIEFDNIENGGHFNIAMSNINSIKYRSIHKYIEGTTNKSVESEYINEHMEEIPKMLDLLVLQKKIKVIRTPFYEKQYELVNNGT